MRKEQTSLEESTARAAFRKGGRGPLNSGKNTSAVLQKSGFWVKGKETQLREGKGGKRG